MKLWAIILSILITGILFLFFYHPEIEKHPDSWAANFSGFLDILTLCGLIFVIVQIRDTKNGRQEQATIEGLTTFIKSHKRNWEKIYSSYKEKAAIPLEEIEGNANIKLLISRCVNILDDYAVGVNQKVYCPNITNKMVGQLFLNSNLKFSAFIKAERKNDPDKYIEFLILCSKIRRLRRSKNRTWFKQKTLEICSIPKARKIYLIVKKNFDPECN